MCGICGKLDVKEEVERSLIEKMCITLAHRGPDDQGVYMGSGIGLGSRRLAIIDLSSAGHMPMSTSSGKSWITYNGEVYNHRELRAELQGHGYSFRSNTDTEVVLYAYDKWGTDCLRRFNGMFALAIWDEERQRLFLARDKMGIKPLYYSINASRIIFASEIKAILQDREVSRELSPEGTRNYFAFGHSVAPRTIFKDIQKLLPGHYITCVRQGQAKLESKVLRYWAPPMPGQSEDAGEKYYAEGVYRLLRESVRRQLISDVPLGVFLSGGIDSSIITSLATSLSQSQVKTFSIGFKTTGTGFNELDDARVVARHFGTDHHELVLDEDDLTDALPTLVYHYDEPFGDQASFPTYLLSKFAREHVTVSLSGEGGDEIFGGYRRYVVENFLANYPALLSLTSNRLAHKFLASSVRSGRWQKLIEALAINDSANRYASWLSVFNEGMRAELFNEAHIPLQNFDPLDVYRSLNTRTGAKRVDILLHIDQQTWLPDTYLEKVDKASMAMSLEVRVPFLDDQVVEFAAGIPAKYKVNGFSTKGILKKAFHSQLPARILQKRKHGFDPPMKLWFRDNLSGFVKDIIFDPRARSRGLFDYDYIEKLYRLHTEKKGLYHDHLWLLVVFELWCQRFLDGEPCVPSGANVENKAQETIAQ